MPASLPGPTVGVVGGGQLGRMLGEAAAPLGIELVVLDPTPDAPAAQVATDQLVADFDDADAIRDLAERSDFLTFEIELADQERLDEVSEATGVPCHPDPATLALIHDKLHQKAALAEAGIPVPPFRRVDDADDLRAALDELGTPAMLKARTGGYDGRGNVPVESVDDAESAMDAVGGPAMVEAFVDYEREISVVAAQGDGEVSTFPVGENIHEEEILREMVVPSHSPEAVLEEAEQVGRDVLDLLDGRGVFAIELFEAADGRILVNEIAPRPHNSGHWSIEGAHTSQFEQHLRAVVGWPLGATDLRAPTVTKNVLADGDGSRPARVDGVEEPLATPGANLHWYGKREARPLRKMGHVTQVATDDESRAELLASARSLVDGLSFE
ncbi:5-(carboxyamino)imidazole ribonucleotide synthase [Haloarchaeobius iranensis]|uniref:N5-carboxyaminoimidazole ribonucleotide synthase n=1 Tax=Haloarchaeobius iranensis TaxID=996166 RepID=A0A1G9WJC4_9EURY|nr:5-(carboxyamino)imidazole ribonucleotide synthase [Haloarchaeobius iranensis]SDM84281.1 5-(carboxyamino)imidazole ribonucleotide synthase [Haloarchaeobius iranensis]